MIAVGRLPTSPTFSARVAVWLALSAGLHGAAWLVLLSLQNRVLPEPEERRVTLIWADQVSGAGDADPAPAVAALAAPAQPPPSPEAAAMPPAPRPVPAPAQPAVSPQLPNPRVGPDTVPAPPDSAPAATDAGMPVSALPRVPQPTEAAGSIEVANPSAPLPALALPLAPPGLPAEFVAPFPQPRQPDALMRPGPPGRQPPGLVERVTSPPLPAPSLSVPRPPAAADAALAEPEALERFELPPPLPMRLSIRRLAAPAALAEAPEARPGGEATGPLVAPRPLAGAANPRPYYPPASQRRGEEGQVQLRLGIDAAGRVVDVAVQRSAGFAALDQSALDAVRRWRFQPATRGGSPVAATVSLGVTFQIQGGR